MNSNKQNLVFVLPCLDIGGVQSVVYRLIKFFSSLGCYNLSVITFTKNGFYREKFIDLGVNIYSFELRFFKGDLKALLGFPYLFYKLINFKGVTKVLGSPGFTALSLCFIKFFLYWKKNLKCGVFIDNKLSKLINAKWHHGVYSFLFFKMSHFLDFINFTYEGAKDDYIENVMKSCNKLSVIYNPVDVSTYDEQIIKRYDFAFVGRLSYEKGPDIFISAINSAMEKKKNLRVVIAGDGPLRDKIIENIKYKDNVAFVGYVDHVQNYILQSKFLVLTSRIEGCSGVIKEALSLGIPCIVPLVESGGPIEMINFGRYGLAYNTFDDLVNCLVNYNLADFDFNEIKKYANKFKIEEVGNCYNKLLIEL